MELSHFLSLLQFEVLKSFDYAVQMNNEWGDTNSPVQLAMDTAEIEIPLMFNCEKKNLNTERLTRILHTDKNIREMKLDFPFNPAIKPMVLCKDTTLSEKNIQPQKIKSKKLDKKRKSKKVKGDVITIQVANQNSKMDKSFDRELIGRIKIVIRPVMK